MTTIPNDVFMLNGIRSFYERWVSEARKEDPVMASRLPKWEHLSPTQVIEWMAAYAATVEVSHRMAKAVGSVMPKE